MFSIKSVEIKDFMSFRGDHTWSLPEANGLYFLTGKNLQNPSLDRNSVGKTTLLNSITWCLYGKTTTGLRAADTVSHGSNTSPRVSVKCVVRSTELTVTRTHSPNSLTLNGTTLDQAALDKALCLNYESFCYAVLLPQGRDMFFELSPAEKLALFSEIMGLDEWLKYSTDALAKQKVLEAEKQIIVRQLAVCIGIMGALSRDIESLKVKSDQWLSKRLAQVGELADQKQGLLNKIAVARAEVRGLGITIEASTKELEIVENETRQLNLTLNELNNTARDLEGELYITQTAIKNAAKALRQFERIAGVCPACDQPVGPIHRQRHIAELEKGLNEHLKDQVELENMKKIVGEDQSKVKTKIMESDTAAWLRAMLNDYCRREALTLNEIKHNNETVVHINNQIKQLETQTNEFDQMIALKQRELEQHTSQKGVIEAKINTTNEQLEAATYWVSGFKRIRLLVIEETLRTLELEVNNNLTALGLPDWRIEFDVERETKSGGIAKQFTVLIYTPEHDKPIKWEAFSAGETQIIKLAGSLGLANLICERAGLVNCTEFYDEASDHLSKEPINSLCEVLCDRAENAKRQIWMVDHSAIEFGGFSGVLTVIKDENGSRLNE